MNNYLRPASCLKRKWMRMAQTILIIMRLKWIQN